MGVEFGDGRQPWSISRRKVKRWMHALVRDVAGLPAPWRAELAGWLADRGVESEVVSLLVTRDADGMDFRVSAAGAAVEVAFTDLPVWLREPTAEPVPVKPARRATRARPAGDDV